MFALALSTAPSAIVAQVVRTESQLSDKRADSKSDDDDADEVYVAVDKMPKFPGGEKAMYKHMSENVSFPQEARDNGISGTVVVRFVVEKDGRVTNVKLLRDIGGGCGQEAVRVIESMPRWKPGRVAGKPVRTEFTMPIEFVLNKD